MLLYFISDVHEIDKFIINDYFLFYYACSAVLFVLNYVWMSSIYVIHLLKNAWLGSSEKSWSHLGMIKDYLCGLNNYIYLNLSMLHLILYKTHPLDCYLSQYILECIYFWSFYGWIAKPNSKKLWSLNTHIKIVLFSGCMFVLTIA